MIYEKEGGPAQPVDFYVDGTRKVYVGMSLRDWFAGHETLSDWDVTGACMPKEAAELLAGRPCPQTGNYVDNLIWEAEWRARLRFIRAEAMLKARLK